MFSTSLFLINSKAHYKSKINIIIRIIHTVEIMHQQLCQLFFNFLRVVVMMCTCVICAVQAVTISMSTLPTVANGMYQVNKYNIVIPLQCYVVYIPLLQVNTVGQVFEPLEDIFFFHYKIFNMITSLVRNSVPLILGPDDFKVPS